MVLWVYLRAVSQQLKRYFIFENQMEMQFVLEGEFAYILSSSYSKNEIGVKSLFDLFVPVPPQIGVKNEDLTPLFSQILIVACLKTPVLPPKVAV